MRSRRKPVVSFVIPTLNRRRYVNRAVRSCLVQQSEDVDVEVIVLDSRSDDGSWEELLAEFADDARVKLLQNERGKGPTASWLDGAAQATGDAVTFVWSDDYIFPWFVESLLPPIMAGASLAFGEGVVRDVDTESLPPARLPPPVILDGLRASRSFLTGFDSELGNLPVSPACALFASSAFRTWMQTVQSFSTVGPLVSHFLWRRAIGPDLLLFLIAAAEHGVAGSAAAFRGPVCQFSAHEGSITVSSSPWRIQMGYWLTRALWFTGVASRPIVDEAARAEIVARLLAHGLLLAMGSRQGAVEEMSRWQVVRGLLFALLSALRRSRSRPIAILGQLARLLGSRVAGRIRSSPGEAFA